MIITMIDTSMLRQRSRALDDAQASRRSSSLHVRVLGIAAMVLAVAGGCRPADVLSVPAPGGVVDPSALHDAAGAAALRAGALEVFSAAMGGFGGVISSISVVQDGGLLGDELTSGDLYRWQVPMDDRSANTATGFETAPGAFMTDQTYGALQKARINALEAADALARFSGPSARSQVGEMFAVVGYSELFLAESFCSGVPLGQLAAAGGVVHGVPLTTDSLLATAALAFDSALAYASDSTRYLARIGLARALMGRGKFAAAKAAVAGVPTAFVYSTARPAYSASYSGLAGMWSWLVAPTTINGSHFASVADGKGGNGQHYVTARDPRMPIDSSQGQTEIHTTLYYPLKFPLGAASVAIPLADGLEARLVEAEAALQANDVNGWTAALNALRADTADTHVAGLFPLTPDSTTTAAPGLQVDVTFRERAFWLYGTGRRLGDLRRLVRQYGRDQATVFSTGAYPLFGNPALSGAVPSVYGNDVNFPILGAEAANPNFHGCLNRAA